MPSVANAGLERSIVMGFSKAVGKTVFMAGLDSWPPLLWLAVGLPRTFGRVCVVRRLAAQFGHQRLNLRWAVL